MWLVRGHEDQIAGGYVMWRARDDDLGFAVQHVDHRVKWCGVLAQALTLIECEHRDGSARSLQERAADDGAVLIGNQIQRANALADSEVQPFPIMASRLSRVLEAPIWT